MKLDYAVLPVEDLETVREWYRRHLNLDTEWDTDSFVLLTGDDGARLGLHRGDPLTEPGAVQLHFAVTDVDSTYRSLRNQGVEFTDRPTDTEWGHRTATCHDPAGHTVELFTPSRT